MRPPKKASRIFSGDVARELAWIAMDLPVVLHDRWMAERQRRVRTVGELQEESPVVPAEAAAEG
jgi:hypothetical protein